MLIPYSNQNRALVSETEEDDDIICLMNWKQCFGQSHEFQVSIKTLHQLEKTEKLSILLHCTKQVQINDVVYTQRHKFGDSNINIVVMAFSTHLDATALLLQHG